MSYLCRAGVVLVGAVLGYGIAAVFADSSGMSCVRTAERTTCWRVEPWWADPAKVLVPLSIAIGLWRLTSWMSAAARREPAQEPASNPLDLAARRTVLGGAWVGVAFVSVSVWTPVIAASTYWRGCDSECLGLAWIVFSSFVAVIPGFVLVAAASSVVRRGRVSMLPRIVATLMGVACGLLSLMALISATALLRGEVFNGLFWTTVFGLPGFGGVISAIGVWRMSRLKGVSPAERPPPGADEPTPLTLLFRPVLATLALVFTGAVGAIVLLAQRSTGPP